MRILVAFLLLANLALAGVLWLDSASGGDVRMVVTGTARSRSSKPLGKAGGGAPRSANTASRWMLTA